MRFLPWALFFVLAAGLSAAPSFRVALVGTPVPWTALRSLEGMSHPLILAVTDGLVTFDPVTGFIKPGLAASWTVDDTGKSWAFTLKPAKWSDGSALTSKDVAESWKKAGVKAALSTTDLKVLKAVFTLPVDGAFVFASPPYLLFPDPATGRSAGPFVFASQEPGRPLVLVRNAAFREARTVKLTQLEFRFVPTLDDATALFRDGLADWVPRGGGPGTWVPSGLRHAVNSPGWGLVFLRFNLNSPRLGDADYRRSLAAALDKTAIAQGLRGPRLLPADALVPGLAKPTLATVPPREGPHPEPALSLLYLQGETSRSIADEVAAQWKRRMGLTVTVTAAPYAQIREARAKGAYDVVLSGWLGDEPDPGAFLELLTSRAQENDTGFSDQAYDSAVGQLGRLFPGKTRDTLVSQALVRVAESVPVVPLLSYAWVNQIDLRRWSGWSPNPTDIHPWQGIGPKKQ